MECRIVTIAIIGVGNVGQKLLEILLDKDGVFKQTYSIKFKPTLVADSTAAVFNPKGFDMQNLLELKRRKGKLREYIAVR